MHVLSMSLRKAHALSMGFTRPDTDVQHGARSLLAAPQPVRGKELCEEVPTPRKATAPAWPAPPHPPCLLSMLHQVSQRLWYL